MTKHGEDDWVAQIIAQLPLAKTRETQPGDDCAAQWISPEFGWLIWKTDAVIEHKHWLPGTPLELVGRKAVARVLSDFAAMAATPRECLLTFCLPPEWTQSNAISLARGAAEILRTSNIIVVGGETSRVPPGHSAIISVAATGFSHQKPIFRHNAQIHDTILVTGKLGGSITHHHLHFTPRLPEAHWLVKNLPIHAMMDLSDGLAQDLPRLARASSVSFHLNLPNIPRNHNCSLQQALSDGEDYELLFTAPTHSLTPEFFSNWAQTFPHTPLHPIGKILPPHLPHTPLTGGWDPFT